jgi:predicted transcriptional regulator
MNSMNDSTDFGVAIRKLMAENKISQNQMAKKLEVSPAILSNYITGKNIPEMSFLAKCIEKFGQKKENPETGVDILDFFYKAFLSAEKSHKKIIVDTRFIDSARIEMLAKVLTVLVLFPNYLLFNFERIENLGIKIDGFFKLLKNNTEYHSPTN